MQILEWKANARPVKTSSLELALEDDEGIAISAHDGNSNIEIYVHRIEDYCFSIRISNRFADRPESMDAVLANIDISANGMCTLNQRQSTLAGER